MKLFFLFLICLILNPLNAQAENIILTGQRAQDLYLNLDLIDQYGTKSFLSSDNLIKIECTMALYQPVCDLTFVSTVDQFSWKEFIAILSGPDVNRSNGVAIITPQLELICRDTCNIKLLF